MHDPDEAGTVFPLERSIRRGSWNRWTFVREPRAGYDERGGMFPRKHPTFSHAFGTRVPAAKQLAGGAALGSESRTS
jgi:hypothetical protein